MRVQPLVALDIGSTKIACVIAQPHDDGAGYELLGAQLRDYPAGVWAWPHDGLVVTRTIDEVLESMGVAQPLTRAVVAFSHQALRSSTVRVAIDLADEPVAIRQRDLARLQAQAIYQVVGIDREPLLIQPLAYSGNGFDTTTPPIGLTATRLGGAVHLITMPVAVRQAITQAVEAAGLDLVQLLYAPASAWEAIRDPQTPAQCLLIDLGGLSTHVALISQGLFHRVEIIEEGGAFLSESLAKTLGLTMTQAELLSQEGLGSRKPQVRQATEQYLATLQRAIARILRGCPRPDLAVITGRGTLIDGLMEAIERANGIKTTLGRSPRLSHRSELSSQVGLSSALGAIELCLRDSPSRRRPTPSTRLVDRWLERTKFLLTEYF